MKVVVLTTSYPRDERDVAGLFVRDAVEAVRAQGVEVEVVSPASFRHFGIAYGHGIAGNLRRRPWLALLLPAFLFNYAWAARRAAQDADLVHAHWLPSALAALKTGKPYVVQLWGTDVELARKAPWLFRPLLRRARLAIVASEYLADAARELGAREVRVVPSGVEIPEAVGEPDEPPHVLFVGRLSPEKGIHEFLAATEGLPRVIVGAGPVDVPEAVGFVPRSELGPYYERAAVVCVPSRREGYGVVAREAMAYGRPVVATAVGGLVDIIGVLVPPGDVARLREVVEQLLARRRLARAPGCAGAAAGRRGDVVGRHGRRASRSLRRLGQRLRNSRSTSAARAPALPSQPGITSPGFGRSSSCGISAIRSGFAPRTVFVPSSSVTRPLGRVPEREAADAECGRLLLDAAGVGQDEGGVGLEAEEVEVAQRLGREHAGVAQASVVAGRLQVAERPRVHREEDRVVAGERDQPVGDRRQLRGVVDERGTVERHEGVLARLKPELLPALPLPGSVEMLEQRVDHRVADEVDAGRDPLALRGS